MTYLTSMNEPRNGFARFAALRRPPRKRWLCEKYENARRIERGLPPKDFGYGYFVDPNFYFDQDEAFHDWLAAELGKFDRGEIAQVRRSSDGGFWERNVFTLLPQPDRNEAQRFLALLDSTATYFTFQTFDDNKERKKANKKNGGDPFAHIYHGTLDKHWDKLCELNAQGAGIFVTVNKTDGKGRETKNIKQVRALFLDLDGAPIEPVTQGKPAPHIVVASSPGKFHPYWLVDDVELDKFEELQKGLIERFGGDNAVFDLPRVMRLPGLVHRKDEPFRSHIISTHEARPYKAADFSGFVKAAAVKTGFKGFSEQRWEHKSPTQKLNDAALANLAAWVPELFPDAAPYHGDGFRVSSASLGRDLEEDISFTREGIKDFGVHDLDDPLDGKRTPVAIVMEHLFEVSVEDIAERKNENKFKKACEWLRERVIPKLGEAKEENKEEEELLPTLRSYFLEELRQRPFVPVQWIAEDFILAQTVNGLFGDGGIGKDLLLFQLVIAMTCGAKWLGRDVKQGRVMYFPVEDDDNELRRRQYWIEKYYTSLGTYQPIPEQLKIVPMLGEQTVIAAFDHESGLVRETDVYATICGMIEEFRPELVVMGNRVNLFGVNQNDDAQARQCMQLLSKICRGYETGIIMPSHVSLARSGADQGTSGSVQWSNGARMRLYLRRPKEDSEPEDPTARELEVMKTNWASTGIIANIRWSEGVFKPDKTLITPVTLDKTRDFEAEQAADEEEVLRLLDERIEGDPVSPKRTANNNICKVFSKSRRFRGQRGKVEVAVKRLLDKGIIEIVEKGPLSRRTHEVVRAGAATKPQSSATVLSFMITQKQKKQLTDLGYSEQAIFEMTPARAHEIIKNGSPPDA